MRLGVRIMTDGICPPAALARAQRLNLRLRENETGQTG